MKKVILVVSFLIGAVLIALAIYLYIRYEYERLGDVDNLTAEDSDELLSEVVRTELTLVKFEFDYYLALSLNSDVKDIVKRFKIEPYATDNLSSKTLEEEYHRLIDSANNIMLLKGMINDNGSNQVNLYDSIEFNYLSYRASLEILSNALKYNQLNPFTPDNITDKLINKKECVIASDSYGSPDFMMEWISLNSSIRASFDKEFYKFFYGRRYYNRHELNNIYDGMLSIYETMKMCKPTNNVTHAISVEDYKGILETYKLKLEVSKLLLSSGDDNRKVIDALNNILKRESITKIIYRNVGRDSFDTLGQLVLFRLYSEGSALNGTD